MVELGLFLITLGLASLFVSQDTWDLWRKKLAWLLFGPPNIRLEELATLFPPDEEIMVIFDNIPGTRTGFHSCAQLRGGQVLVIYHRMNLQVGLVEMVEMSSPQKAGITLTVKDETVVALKYVGGRMIPNPRMTPDGQSAVMCFLRRIRGLAKAVS